MNCFLKILIFLSELSNSLKKNSIKHLIYLSSDAVYADINEPLTELSVTQPESLHGIMHLSREVMLKQLNGIPKCFIRPTLIFGIKDPHNGYGPNQFIRLSEKNDDIKSILGEQISDLEIAAFSMRLEEIIANPIFPVLDPYRDVPWPLV